MPALRNPRREKACHEFLKCGVQAKAYLKAGYTASTRNALDVSASRLFRDAKVQRRIHELRRHMASRTAVTVESLSEELDEAKALALKIDQPSAAVSAITVKAKLFGHLVDRKEVGKPGEFTDAQSPADVLAQVREQLGVDAAEALERAIGVETSQAPAAVVEQASEPATPTHDGSGSLN